MAANHMLENTLKEILVVVQPLQDDWVKRFQVIDALRGVVASTESLRGATVEPFGSFVSNLFSRWGDLDISIQLHNGSFISSAGKKHKQKLLGDILEALRGKGGWCRLKLVVNARVPILKVDSSRQNISCDLSIDNLLGQTKSKILLWINEIDARFRDMVLLVKEWAKAHGINNPRSGTFNSYSLCLLVIFHFQTCVPAILPPLRDIYPGNIVDELQGVRDSVERRIAETCVANIARFRANRSRTINRSSLSELFISFLAKFSDICLRAPELGICTYTAQWEEINSNMRWLPKTHALFIEDPFEQPENTTRAVNTRQLSRISEAFARTHHRLVSVQQTQNSLLAELVRPQISQLISKPPARIPRYNNEHYFPRQPQARRTRVIPSSPVMRNPFQLQNTRLESHPKNHSFPVAHHQSHVARSESHPNNSKTRGSWAHPNQIPQTFQAHSNQFPQTWRPRSPS